MGGGARNLRWISEEKILKNLCGSGVGGCSSIDWFWLRGWLINKGAICTRTAPLFWIFISLFQNPRTRSVRKIGSQNQSITGKRFSYYMSICTISWRSGNGTVMGTHVCVHCTQTMGSTQSWISTARVSVLPPTSLDTGAGQSKRSQNTKEQEILAVKLKDLSSTRKAPYTVNLTILYWH